MHVYFLCVCVLVQGKIKADTAMEAKDTPLQEKLEDMAKQIGYFGFFFAILTFIAMIVSWFVGTHRLRALAFAGRAVVAWLLWC